MNIDNMIAENTIRTFDQVPPDYLRNLVDQMAEAGCEPIDLRNNLIRLILLFHKVAPSEQWALVDTLVRLIFMQTDEFGDALKAYLLKLERDMPPMTSQPPGAK